MKTYQDILDLLNMVGVDIIEETLFYNDYKQLDATLIIENTLTNEDISGSTWMEVESILDSWTDSWTIDENTNTIKFIIDDD